MTNDTLSEILIEKYGLELYKKAQDFPYNKINIISLKETPIKISSIILDNDREFHLIINEKRGEIFHDCPTFLIHSERHDKICIHIVKLLLILPPSISLKILVDINNFNLTSEDFGSKKKSKNFLKLANSFFENNNCVEGLNYLNKAIINQFECDTIIQKYLQIALENNLFIEVFEFLKNSYENDLHEYLSKYNDYIERSFKLFLNTVSKYSFYEILRIIESIDKILDEYEFQNTSVVKSLLEKLAKMVKSTNYNEKYFSMFMIKKNYKKVISFDQSFKELISPEEYEIFKNEILGNFLDEIENFSIIDKLKLMKDQFVIFEIPENDYYDKYKEYKKEIRELEKKVYLKKFSFLKLFVEQYNIKRTKGEFRKKRNTYIITHNKDNIENPAYNYIIKHIGFFGLNNSTIKSSEIGINYLIIKELYSDDLTNFPDIFYYRKQFWGEENEHEIRPVNGITLLSAPINYNYDIDQNYSNVNEVIIIEWDLANKPRQGSLVNAYGSQIIIPDQNNPLFHDLRPFDLCYCKKIPVKIEGNIVKTINIISKCSFKDAINSIKKGMEYIEGYYPLSRVSSVLNKEISPFKANEIVINNPNKQFIPNYNQFVKAFREFLFNFINNEKDYIFDHFKSSTETRADQILILLNLTTDLAGLDLPYSEIIKKILIQDISLKEFRTKLVEEIHSFIRNILDKKKIGRTSIFNLKKMRHTPFIKYSEEILKIRKDEFEDAKIFKDINKSEVWYDLSEVSKTYYGGKFFEIINLKAKARVNQDILNKLTNFASKLQIKLNFIEIAI